MSGNFTEFWIHVTSVVLPRDVHEHKLHESRLILTDDNTVANIDIETESLQYRPTLDKRFCLPLNVVERVACQFAKRCDSYT